jgi:hypothetical protein
MCRLQQYTGKYDKPVRLYKLHGSLYNYIYQKNNKAEKHIKVTKNTIPTDLYMEIKDDAGNKRYDNDFTNYHPDFLTGIQSKKIRYNEPFYKQLLDTFKRNMRCSKMLIIIGYGFKDDVINDVIIKYFKRKKYPCIIIDPYANDVVAHFVRKIGKKAKLLRKEMQRVKLADFILDNRGKCRKLKCLKGHCKKRKMKKITIKNNARTLLSLKDAELIYTTEIPYELIPHI